jgi:DNA-binding beta-propeller fold protein YncE
VQEDAPIEVSCGKSKYRWVDNWAKIPDTQSARTGWAHHGIVVTKGGEVITFHQSDRTALVLGGGGELVRSWQTDLAEGHGITLVTEEGTEKLWIADIGTKRMSEFNYEYPTADPLPSGRVVKMDLDGRVTMRLPKPNFEGYAKTRYAPTSVAVDEESLGGSGDIWVTDGYGLNLLHRFNSEGKYQSTIDGTDGAGRFSTPHSVFIDRRKRDPELYVADRSNKRVQVFDLEGRFKRAFGSDFLTSPSGFAVHGGQLFIAELRARVAVLDIKDRLVGYLGENEAACDIDGWPNKKRSDGEIVRTDGLGAGKFNSPHGIATDTAGNVYVAEWLIGGRIVKLVRA